MESKDEMVDLMVIEHEEAVEDYEDDGEELEDEDEGPPPLPARDYEEFCDPLKVVKDLQDTQEITRAEPEEKLLRDKSEEKDGIKAREEFIKHHEDFTDTQDQVAITRATRATLERENDTVIEEMIEPDKSTEGCETTTIKEDILIDSTEEIKKGLPSSELENSEAVAEETERNDVESSESAQSTESPCQLESSELPIDAEKEATNNVTDSDGEALTSRQMIASLTEELADNVIMGDDGTKPQEVEETVDVLDDVEELEVDLTDPAVEAAATKIQSAFKGYKTRQSLSDN